MNKIVIDLEFCKIGSRFKEQRKISHFEMIQLGAVKLDNNDEIVGRFNQLVRPDYAHIDTTVERLTKITDAKVKHALGFQEVMKAFLEWIGAEETVVLSWSLEDKRQLVNESRLKNFQDEKLDFLFRTWVDFQQTVGDLLGVEQKLSLTNALRGSGIIFIGQEHSALDDAENTAVLYQLTQNEDKFKERVQPILDLLKPTEALTFSMGNLLSDFAVDQCCVS